MVSLNLLRFPLRCGMTNYLDTEYHLDLTGEGKCDALDCGADSTMLFEMLNIEAPSGTSMEGKISVAEYCSLHGVQAHLNTQSFRYLRQVEHEHEYVDSNDPGQPETNVSVCIHCGHEQI